MEVVTRYLKSSIYRRQSRDKIIINKYARETGKACYARAMGLSAASKRQLLRKTHPAYAKEAQGMKEKKMGRVMKEFKMGKLHSIGREGKGRCIWEI